MIPMKGLDGMFVIETGNVSVLIQKRCRFIDVHNFRAFISALKFEIMHSLLSMNQFLKS